SRRVRVRHRPAIRYAAHPCAGSPAGQAPVPRLGARAFPALCFFLPSSFLPAAEVFGYIEMYARAYRLITEKGGRLMRKHLAAPRLRWLPSAALFTVCCWFLFRYPDVCAEGVRNGLTLCGTLVLPALFPFLAVSVFLLRSGLLQLFG